MASHNSCRVPNQQSHVVGLHTLAIRGRHKAKALIIPSIFLKSQNSLDKIHQNRNTWQSHPGETLHALPKIHLLRLRHQTHRLGSGKDRLLNTAKPTSLLHAWIQPAVASRQAECRLEVTSQVRGHLQHRKWKNQRCCAVPISTSLTPC